MSQSRAQVVSRDFDWSLVVAGPIEHGNSWPRRFAAIPLWKSESQLIDLRPFGLFEMNSRKRPHAGEMLGFLTYGDRSLKYVGSDLGVRIMDGEKCLAEIFRTRWWELFGCAWWSVVDSDSQRLYAIRRRLRGVVNVVSEVASANDVNLTCTVLKREAMVHPELFWHRHSITENEWNPPERFLKSNAAFRIIEQMTGCSVRKERSQDLFRLSPPRQMPKLFDIDVVDSEPHRSLLIASSLWCAAWCIFQ